MRYAASGGAVVAQARRDLYQTYSQWLRVAPGEVLYGGAGGALAFFQQHLSDPACDVSLPGTDGGDARPGALPVWASNC